ncbi:SCO family protein [Ramlibacter solisilvae]|uniref:Photosynthetic protein synthase I n=1 Tax=Ramlibacter tataouinensis TaxID=94132 RepID=A0A127JS12_9BURK|nr:SCO family protein [Ramlibacter tataouinensis]AMO22784.1 photosynthetic protein synthase I [Ramlibacter tataouinensis]
MNRRFALSALSVSAALLALGCSPSKPQFSGIDLSGADYAKDFQMPDQNGQMRSLKDFRGKLVAIFFGYTQCPDVCPTTLTEMVEAKRLLGPDGDKLQVIFVTVDPERDTQELLKAYMANFDPGFIALRGSPEQLAAMAKDFKVYYKKVDGKTPTSYTMDHSAASYVYDAEGRLRLYTRYGSGAQPLASDMKLLLKQG